MNMVVTQAIGLLAMGCVLWSFQQNKRSRILVWLIVGQCLFSLHYGLLGAWTASVINLVAVTRGIIFYFKPNYAWARYAWWPYFYMVIFCVAGLSTWAGYHSLLTIIASCIETIGLWRKHTKHIRWVMLGVRPLYFIYALLVGSYAGMIADTVFSISLMTSMWRFDRKIKNKS